MNRSRIFDLLVRYNTNTEAHRAIILPVLLYRCETSSLILREERRQRVLGRIFDT